MTCGDCGRPIVGARGARRCLGPCKIPMYGGVVDAGRCYRCGYVGLGKGPEFTECPRCEGWGDERMPVPPAGHHWLIRYRRARPSQSRNSPCACGSGRKFKRCCGA